MWEIPVLLLIYMLLYYFQKIQKAEQHRTTEIVAEIHPSETEKTENASPEEKTIRTTIQQTEEVPPEVKNGGAKVEVMEKKSSEVSKKRGKVPVLEYQILRENRVEMVKLDPKKLIPHLEQNKVIDQDDVEQIKKKCKKLRRKGAETMLNIVYNSGSWAFKKLIAALQQSGYKEMADKLTGDLKKKITGSRSVTKSKERGSLSELEFEVLRENHVRMVDELDSSVLKNYLFKNEIIDEDDLEKITMKEEKRRRKGVEAMVKIIHKSGANAFPRLLKSLDEAGYDELSLKLDSDLKKKKKEGANVGLKIDLNSVAFPDYPFSPQLKLQTIQGDDVVSNWQQKITKWKKNDGGKLWCDAMNKWFRNHEFKSKEELKMVVKEWLSKLEEVVNKSCLEIDKINIILDVTETLLLLDNNNSIFHLDDMFIFMNIIKDFAPKCTIKKDIEDFVQINKEEKQRLLEQHRQVIEILKHNLEGIIEEKQNLELLPIDTERCGLTDHFHSVVYDVRDKWHKLLTKP